MDNAIHTPTIPPMVFFRLNLARLIRQYGWTMVELAARSGVSRSQIKQVLDGDREITVKRAAMIAAAFGLELGDMLVDLKNLHRVSADAKVTP